MRKLLANSLIVGMILALLCGCAAVRSVLQMEPERVEMVLLTGLMWVDDEGKRVSGIKVPAVVGDFTPVCYMYDWEERGDVIDLHYAPLAGGPMLYCIVAKLGCPEGVGLSTYNKDTEECTFWIYDSEGQAWEVNEEKYTYFMASDHPCKVDTPEGIDAILTI